MNKSGNLEIITGPMKSGKSTALFNMYIDKRFDNKNDCLLFSSILDDRNIRSLTDTIKIASLKDLYKYKEKYIYIDEAQFFNPNEYIIILDLIDKGKYIYISGLNLTSDNKPFVFIKNLMPYANQIYILKAICDDCKSSNATKTYCKADKTKNILVGDDIYLSLCNECYKKRMNERNEKNRQN